MPAAVALAGPRDIALPNALKEGFLGSPTGADRRTVEPDRPGVVDADTWGFGGKEADMGSPRRAAAVEGALEVDAAGAVLA